MDGKCNDHPKSWKDTEDRGSSASQADHRTHLSDCKMSCTRHCPKQAVSKAVEITRAQWVCSQWRCVSRLEANTITSSRLWCPIQ